MFTFDYEIKYQLQRLWEELAKPKKQQSQKTIQRLKSEIRRHYKWGLYQEEIKPKNKQDKLVINWLKYEIKRTFSDNYGM